MTREEKTKQLETLITQLVGGHAGRCSGCGGVYRFDTSVPSVVWNAVIRAQGLPDYLCAACIVGVFARQKRSFTAILSGEGLDLVPIEIRIANNVALDAEAIQHENNDLRCQIRELQQAVNAGATPSAEGATESAHPSASTSRPDRRGPQEQETRT